ncbi:MAG TPA: hypothetical protein VEI26_02570 [Terriglobales bacterium]|nr:hypothetical protein [Terriglobales bacterium]
MSEKIEKRPNGYGFANLGGFVICWKRPRFVLACILLAGAIVLCSTALSSEKPNADATANQSNSAKPEVRRYFPLTKFYDTPTPLPAGKPGELIRKEEFDEYDLSPSVLATRILYHSRSARGEDVAASGVVLYPEGKTPAGGWPVIAWAHDLNGVARRCAPSLSRNLQHGPLLSMYVGLGYAVVASDYAGLGSSFRNAFADMQSNGSDVINSVPAARAAVPPLGARWVAIGTGEGSLAVISVAELEHDTGDSNYLGAIAISGLSDLQDRYARPDPASLFLLAYGIKTIFPEFNPADMLTEKGLGLLTQIENGCGGPETVQNKLPESELFQPNWQSNNIVRQYFARSAPGQKPASGPILVIASEADPGGATSRALARMCRQGDKVQLDQYEVADPGSLIGDSVRAQIEWIQGRFAGRSAPGNCSGQH